MGAVKIGICAKEKRDQVSKFQIEKCRLAPRDLTWRRFMRKNIQHIKYVLALLLVFSSQALHATQYSHAEALALYTAHNLCMPSPQGDGRIQTLNKKGAMSPALDIASLQFIKDSANKKVLEIGGAYGKVMFEVLSKNSGTEYHINDLDERHLFIAAGNLQNGIEKGNISQAVLPKVKYISGDITNKNFPIAEKYDAILIARVMHFFSPEKMDSAITNFARLLKPQGRI